MQRASLLYGSPPVAQPLPLLAKGFRPFFVLAAAYAVSMLLIWLGVLRGVLAPPGYLDATVWHAHEMLAGFATAVIAGFLLTAVGNWTQRETATGRWLALLALLWLSGRAAVWWGAHLPRGVPALVDLAFLPALAVTLARPLIASGNRRNFVMLAILAALFVANLAVHAEALSLLTTGTARRANLISVELIVLLCSVICGRVLPMFTRNATGVQAIRSNATLDRLSIAALVALVLVDLFWPRAMLLSGAVAALAAVLAAARSAHWGTRHSLRDPLLWILHAGYVWLVLGLFLRAFSSFVSPAAASLATHALTAGAIGSLTLGMMARVSLGHTGRMLKAPSSMSAAFVAITLAAIARVLVPWVRPDWYIASLSFAAVAWSFAFATFLVAYLPMLSQPRVDGRPG